MARTCSPPAEARRPGHPSSGHPRPARSTTPVPRRPERRRCCRPIGPATMAAALLAAGCGSAPPAGTANLSDSPITNASPAPPLDRCPPRAPAAHTSLPAVTLHCLGPGESVDLTQLPPAAYVINLWASWCIPCQREAPRLRAAAAANRGKVAFLGIDTADSRGSALDFLSHVHLSYAQVFDPSSDALHRLGAPGLPVTLALDAAGRIVYRRIGEISVDQLAAAVHAANPTGQPTTAGHR